MERSAGDAQARVFTVSELAAGLRQLLETRVGRVWVAGEVSNLRQPPSGHVYFTLKDPRAQLTAVLFRGNARLLRFEPEDGLEVLVFAEVGLYEPRGDLQLVVRHLEPRGQGALQLAFEQLRRRLEAEGLFAAERKRPIPALPRAVGVVTSASGAALRDVLEVTGQRFPAVPLVIAATRVQGEGAEREIAAALRAIQSHREVDVVLLVRGGGSLEDLQPYNTEIVARAIAESRVPVVTGVGHEIDVTIADLAADERAPTPSAAAARVVPDRAAWAARVAAVEARLRATMRRLLERASDRHSRAQEALRAQAPTARLAARRVRLDAAARALARATEARLSRADQRLARAAAGLQALSPLAVLARGYAIAERDGAILRSADRVAPGDAIRVRLARGALAAAVTSVEAATESGHGSSDD